MTFALTIVALVVVMAIAWRYLGSYMAAVYEGRTRWLSRVERPIYRVCGVDPANEQSWQRYSVSLIAFSSVALLISYLIFRLQGVLPFNPQHLGAVTPALAWNTSVSFVTNTNWQSYSGETTMSYLSQMASLAVQNFLSAAAGIAVAVALIRGFSRRGAKTIGNFWADLIRGTLYVLLPISFVAAIIFMAQGAVQTLGGPAHIFDALNGVRQVIPLGPVASQEAIKQLGTNGGGFFNANGAMPFENPTGLTNFLSIVLILWGIARQAIEITPRCWNALILKRATSAISKEKSTSCSRANSASFVSSVSSSFSAPSTSSAVSWSALSSTASSP